MKKGILLAGIFVVLILTACGTTATVSVATTTAGAPVVASAITPTTPPAAAALAKAFHWTRYDYAVDILDDGDMLFRVTMGFAFDSGSFSQGYYSFDMDRLDDVHDVAVFESSQPYIQVSEERVGGFQVNKGSEFEVLWWFPPTANAERTFTLTFRVVGGLRVYDEGDQFYWNFYGGVRSGHIDSGTITVHLPQAASPYAVQMAVEPGGTPLALIDDHTVQAQVFGLPVNRAVVLGLQFPHGLVSAEPAAWQIEEEP